MAKYRTIDALNEAWDTSHASWDALLATTDTPDKKRAWDDLTAFYQEIVETYFSTVHAELEAVAPDVMYLG